MGSSPITKAASANMSGFLYSGGGTNNFSITKLPRGVAGHKDDTDTPENQNTYYAWVSAKMSRKWITYHYKLLVLVFKMIFFNILKEYRGIYRFLSTPGPSHDTELSFRL